MRDSRPRFAEIKDGLRQILNDPQWFRKILLGGILLINPILLVLAPMVFSRRSPSWADELFLWLLVFNVVSFWFPLGFTFEVLRRARSGHGAQLPEWKLSLLPRYAREGAIKFLLACATLLLPSAIGLGCGCLLFSKLFRLPPSALGLLMPALFWFAIPFCAVACCRWLDGQPVWQCALGYLRTWRLFRRAMPDYLIASAILSGVNAILNAFFVTIPFALLFGLCLVDTWFGPIYRNTVDQNEESET